MRIFGNDFEKLSEKKFCEFAQFSQRRVCRCDAKVFVDSLKRFEDGDVEEKSGKRAVEGDPVEHLDDAEVGELRVVFVVGE